jgi:polar amino acid transport system permease protein
MAKRRKLTKLDIVLFGIVVLAVVLIAHRVNDVLVYHWNWSRVLPFFMRFDEKTATWIPNLLLQGLATTLRLAVWGTILSTIIGLAMGMCRVSHHLTFRIISRTYVELIRNIPPVVFIFVFYFFISNQIFPAVGLDDAASGSTWMRGVTFRVLFGDPTLFVNFLSGLICLSLFEGAYITEIVRAGIQSIKKGQWEAAQSIGLSRVNILRDIIMPQALRKILPPLAGQFIMLIKDSAIVSLISVQELTFLANEVANSTTRVFETWILVGAMYFVLCYGFAFIFQRIESRAKQSNR